MKAVGGIELTGDPEKFRRMIASSANLRDTPDGKVIDSYPDGFILTEGRKGDWDFIRGYWDRNCDTGWTHAKNLKNVTRRRIKEGLDKRDRTDYSR